ncbi:hypothetical protein EZV62_014403 [Acer yangbiense]|uniref:Uncharacterized protein n=1 Tax=Acer yangbiense TaxID=1000413 RepID=A0A5C7HS56_9ROSI|nr:hypothetical protein EZV62_014403 [Acer yangbiense]
MNLHAVKATPISYCTNFNSNLELNENLLKIYFNSNGFVPSDLLAEGFGVKEIVPAYLDPNLQLKDLITGEQEELQLSTPQIGCVPSQRTISGGIARECSEPANQAAQLFNSKFSSVIGSLSQKFPDSKIVFLDVYTPLLSLIQNPANYEGFASLSSLFKQMMHALL